MYIKYHHIWKVVWLVPVLICIISACSSKTEVEESPKETYCIPATLRERIDLAKVKMAPMVESRRLSGKVEYNPDKVLPYVSLVEGVITNTWFSLGDQVKKGQLLAEIRSSELSGLEAERRTLEAKYKVAQRQVQSTKEMYDDGIASERALIEAQSEEESIQADLQRVKSNLSLFKSGDESDLFRIVAPASGFIVRKNITPGRQVVADSDPLFVISDLSNVWVLANVYAGDIMYIREGMQATMETSAYKGEQFKGSVQSLSQVFDSEEKVIKARIVMSNPELKLKPGMFIDVNVSKEVDNEAIHVPQRALIFSNNRHYVVVYTSDCELSVRQVEILGKDGNNVFLKGNLQPEEQVLTQNQLLVFEAIQSN
ncbi:MAG: efflux RND transporter periplasmic adaptor subunit [Cyclobacteriaceae bacterium]